MFFKSCALALAALSLETVIAAPSHHGHAHLHKARSDAAEKRDAANFDDPSLYANVNWATVSYTGAFGAATSAAASVAPAAVTPVSSAAAQAYSAPAAAASSGLTSQARSVGQSASSAASSAVSSAPASVSGASSGTSEGTAFGGKTNPNPEGNIYEYMGNVGSPRGSNMLLITNDQASSFKYINNFTSTATGPRRWILWNKSGPDGQPNSGQYLTPVKDFTIPAGGFQVVAFDDDTQAVACDWTGQQTNPSMGGSKMCAYIEMDFCNSSNNGWSGYDVSNIQNVGGQCDVSVHDAASSGPVSSCTENSYNSGNVDQGGIGGNLAPGNVKLITQFGS